MPSTTSRPEVLKKLKVMMEKSPVFEINTVHNFFPILIVVIVLVGIFIGIKGSGGFDCATIKNPSFGLLSRYASAIAFAMG